jgi:hypothetical protein
VEQAHGPSYTGGRGRRIKVQDWPQAEVGDPTQKITKSKMG